jgi:cytochrome c-type biogenesis protein CcmF
MLCLWVPRCDLTERLYNMENLGYLSLILAFSVSVYAVVAALVGKWRGKPFLEVSAQRAVLAAWLLVTTASGLLLYAILTDNFRLSYVASRSNVDLPTVYKFAAWWGGQEGSLLFWSWIAATYAFVAVFTARRRHQDMVSYVVAIMMTVLAFFVGLIAFVANPFQVLMSGPQVVAAQDGQGLNPLLQHPMMAIHPPMLYLGYVGFAVPFAFAMASLITRQPGDRWIHTTRVWTMITWLFQSGCCSARAGPTPCWDGAVIGAGTRSRTPRCCRGLPAPRFCIR